MSSESISELWLESNRKVVHIKDPSKSGPSSPRFFPQSGAPYSKTAVGTSYTPNGDYPIGGDLTNDTTQPSIFFELDDMRVVNNPNDRTRFSDRLRNGEAKEEKKSFACRFFIFIIIIVIIIYYYFFYKK